MPGNGNWKVISIIVTVLFVIAIPSLVTAVVRNDLKRQTEDQRVEKDHKEDITAVDEKCEQRNRDVVVQVEGLKADMNKNFRQLFVEVGKIQAKME